MVDKKLPFDILLVQSKEAQLFSLGSRYYQNADLFLPYPLSHQREGKSLLCRIGEHVESVDGPVISHAGQIGRFAILKVLNCLSKIYTRMIFIGLEKRKRNVEILGSFPA